MIQLDRAATVIGVEPVRSVLSGILLELNYNAQIITKICSSLNQMIEAEGAYPMQRLGSDAVSSYLQRPHTTLIQHYSLLQNYWQAVTMFNRIVDSIDTPVSAADYIQKRAEGAYDVPKQIDGISAQLVPLVATRLAELGPLVKP